MAAIRCSLACIATDRTRPILDGRIPIPGCEIVPLTGEPEDVFTRALRDNAFDITELSMSSHMVLTARDEAAYIGIPAFTSRSFRHSSIYVRTDRGLSSAADLKGRRIGLPEYQQTAALWVRGILQDEYDVAPHEISWRTGGLERPGHGERIPLQLPSHLDVKPIGQDQTLNDLLVLGEIDAIISPRPPSCFVKHSAPVSRLFPDFESSEIEYAKKTGFFPIMHCMAVRRELADKHPWLPFEIFRAFAKAKAAALEELALVNVLRVALPWAAGQYDQARAVLGDPIWSYGYPRNRRELETMTRYAFSDGLVARKLDAAELFHAGTLHAADVQ